ncbi:hypothetical protein DPEC_G00168650 [Dallia pectoralis]|uniref:Uncharacterized protein n=1 Tax=Dallia pectoralis TaxID=75939 RepID=A0ACC2GCL8_DALPE|nr:hypothetical protein DPEC_G00168650 [Dallia pectoralis]
MFPALRGETSKHPATLSPALCSVMDTSVKSEEAFPTPPPYFLPSQGKPSDDMRFYSSPFAPPPLTPSMTNSYINLTPCEDSKQDKNVRIYHINHRQPRTDAVMSDGTSFPGQSSGMQFQTELGVSPGQTRCPSCQTQVTTDVRTSAGSFAWTMCLVFILCGLILGCCLIPFLVRHFKDTYHTCPRCQMVLYIHKKTCCPATSDLRPTT